jgi:hypothetical protein
LDLPPPWRRFLRNRLALIASIFVAACAMAATSVAGAAQVRLEAEVDAHWRGAYDILVRPPGDTLDLETTNGLVEPNFLSFSGHGGISLAQVDQIRATPGVEIAAPVAFIGQLSVSQTSPTVVIDQVPKSPTLYRLTVTVSTSDGISSRLIDQTTSRVLLGPAPKGSDASLAITDAAGGLAMNGDVPDIEITPSGPTQVLPALDSPMLAVDPTAEQQLLGSTGTFLDPLIEADSKGPTTVSTFDLSQLPAHTDASARIHFMRNSPSSVVQGRPVFPVLLSAHTYAPVTVTLTVDQLGHALDRAPADRGAGPASELDRAQQEAGSTVTNVGTSSVDAGPNLRPLVVNTLAVPWPGSSLPQEGIETPVAPTSTFQSQLVSRPAYTQANPPTGSTSPSFRIDPRGLVGPGGGPVETSTGSTSPVLAPEKHGVEQAYRSSIEQPVPIARTYVPQGPIDQPYVLAPVGEFDLGALDLPDDPLDYVPFGAYDPPDTTLVADSSGTPVAPKTMTPTLDPLGLLQVPPLAITDLDAAVALRGPSPIDAVRVRVAEITDYGQDAVDRVEQVAQAIAALGLDVQVVAGSSPQAVDLYVPGYDTTTTPPGDLGWVEQHWTTLGAAARVSSGLGDADVALLVLTLLAVGVAVAGLQLLVGATRRRERAILSAMGWTRRRILVWRVSEALVSGAVVLLVGVAAWLALGTEPAGLVVAFGGAIAFPLASLASEGLRWRDDPDALGSEERSPTARLNVRSVGGASTFGLRHVLARPWRSVTLAVALGLAAATVAVAAILLATLAQQVGPTELASALSARLRVYQLALLALDGIGSIGYVVLAVRTDLRARSGELEVLSAAGWRPRDVNGLLRWERAWIAVPAAAIAFVLALALVGPVAGSGSAWLPAGALASVLAASTVLWARVASFRLAGR